jgi:hypothetical protein
MPNFVNGDPTKNLIPVFDPYPEQKNVVITESPNATVTDLSDTETWKFQVGTEDFIDLVAALSLTARAATVIKTNPVLKGTVIDELNFTWTYNKDVTSQTLTNNGGLTPPTLGPSDRLYNYNGLSLSSDIDFTLQGNDGLGQTGSVDSDVKSVIFGNFMWLGHGASRLGTSAASLESFLEALGTSQVKTSRAHTYYATGGTNQHHFVAYPKAWGLGTFTKGVFEGGYVRIFNVGGTIVSSGTPESDIIITNQAGYAEAYYVYQSLYDNQNDPVTPFVIS